MGRIGTSWRKWDDDGSSCAGVVVGVRDDAVVELAGSCEGRRVGFERVVDKR